jgi:phage gpG-like protein
VRSDSVKIVGTEKLAARYATFSQALRARLGLAVERLATEMVGKVKRDQLSGRPPGALFRRSGTLSRSIHHDITSDTSGVRATVGTNIIYGRTHELGFKGTVAVGPHRRRVKGKDIYSRLKMPGKRVKKKLMVKGYSTVKGHKRKMNLPARPFLRPVLDAMRTDIRQALRDAITGAIHYDA